MIYNRTAEDVKIAKQIRDTVVKSFQQPNDEQLEQLEKGFLTINTLNRIEEKQEDLKSKLESIGYFNVSVDTRRWFEGDIFFDSDIERLKRNNVVLKNASPSVSYFPDQPSSVLDYESLNKMEKLLNDIEEIFEKISQNYLQCGTFECGGFKL